MVSVHKNLIFLSTLFLSLASLTAHLPLQTYIVQLHPRVKTAPSFASKVEWHRSFLVQAVSSEEEDNASSRLLYSYRSTMEGFAALLSEPEVASLRKLHEVVAIRPDRRLELHTIYSYKFLGLDAPRVGAWSRNAFRRGAIIGVLDTGVWPESPSFSDRGMPSLLGSGEGCVKRGKTLTPRGFEMVQCNHFKDLLYSLLSH